MLKPGEREAIANWWGRSRGLQGAVYGFGAGVIGALFATGLYFGDYIVDTYGERG